MSTILNNSDSIKYYENEEYKKNIKEKHDKISLNLQGYKGMLDCNILESVHKLNLHRCLNIKNIDALKFAHDICLSDCNITDVSMLKNVKYLDLNRCENITDVSMLGSVYKLVLSQCTNIKDVRKLGKIHELQLSRCTNITDENERRIKN